MGLANKLKMIAEKIRQFPVIEDDDLVYEFVDNAIDWADTLVKAAGILEPVDPPALPPQ